MDLTYRVLFTDKQKTHLGVGSHKISFLFHLVHFARAHFDRSEDVDKLQQENIISTVIPNVDAITEVERTMAERCLLLNAGSTSSSKGKGNLLWSRVPGTLNNAVTQFERLDADGLSTIRKFEINIHESTTKVFAWLMDVAR